MKESSSYRNTYLKMDEVPDLVLLLLYLLKYLTPCFILGFLSPWKTEGFVIVHFKTFRIIKNKTIDLRILSFGTPSFEYLGQRK